MSDLELVLLTTDDTAGLRERYELRSAVYQHDLPYEPPVSLRDEMASLAYPYPGGRNYDWLARRDGTVVGAAHLHYPDLDNTDNATIDIMIHPSHRRRGFGRAMYEHLLAEIRAEGRIRVIAELCEDGPDAPPEGRGGVVYAAGLGFTQALVEVRRRLDLTKIEPGLHERLLAESEAASPDYHLVHWQERVPDELLDEIAYLEHRMSVDPPLGELKWEPEKYDGDRIRATESANIGRGRHVYAAAAIHTATGAAVGYTVLSVDDDVPTHAWQWATLVRATAPSTAGRSGSSSSPEP
jgi:GNAT superfamily N-acetyltransferase